MYVPAAEDLQIRRQNTTVLNGPGAMAINATNENVGIINARPASEVAEQWQPHTVHCNVKCDQFLRDFN